MSDIRIWIILFVSVGGVIATLVSNWAIRGNDLKHLKESIESLRVELLKRIERLEQRFFDKGD